jgi:hypothetical protein
MKKATIFRLSLLLCALCCLLLCSACGAKQDTKGPVLSECGIEHEQEFGGVYITRSIDDFNALGFAYGDSVNVTFSSGYTLEDLPY